MRRMHEKENSDWYFGLGGGSLVIGETVVPVTKLPFVYTCPFAPNEYAFLDEEGNQIN